MSISFDNRRLLYTVLSAMAIVVGVNLYKYAKSINNDYIRYMATSLFVGGWLGIGYSIVDGNRNIVKRALGYGSVLLIIAGAMGMRMEFDKGNRAPQWASFTFLLGWLGIAAALTYDSGLSIKSIIGIISTITIVAGAMLTRKSEEARKLPNMGKLLFSTGWIMLVISNGLN